MTHAGVGARTYERRIGDRLCGTLDPLGGLLATIALAITISLQANLCGHAMAASGPLKNAAAVHVEDLYKGVPAGTDAADQEGYNAARKAAEQLKLDFLGSFANPQKNAANQTAWDEEESQLISDSLKYGGDVTLDAAAMYWGATQLSLPVISAEQLVAQAKAMPVGDQPAEASFNAYMAKYLAVRFTALNKLAGSYHSAVDDIDGRDLPLSLADLQAQLRLDGTHPVKATG